MTDFRKMMGEDQEDNGSYELPKTEQDTNTYFESQPDSQCYEHAEEI